MNFRLQKKAVQIAAIFSVLSSGSALSSSTNLIFAEDKIMLVSPEDGGSPRDPTKIVELGTNRFQLYCELPSDNRPYFMLDAVNPFTSAQVLTIEIENPPDPPYYYFMTPEGKWSRRYLNENTNILEVSIPPGKSRLSTVPYYNYGDYISYIESLNDSRITKTVACTDENGKYKIYKIRVTNPGGITNKMKICYIRTLHNQETSGYYMAQGIIAWLLSGDPAANLDNIIWTVYPCFAPKAVHDHYKYNEIETELYDNGKTGQQAYDEEIRNGKHHVIQTEHMWCNEHHLLEQENYEYHDPFYGYTEQLYFPDTPPPSDLWNDWMAYWPHWFEWGTDYYSHRNGKYWDNANYGGFTMINEIMFYGKDSGGDVSANLREQGKQWARAASQVYMHFQKDHNYFTSSHPCGTFDLTGAVLLPKPQHILAETLTPVSGTCKINQNGNSGSMYIYKKKYDHGLGMKAGDSVTFTIPQGCNSFKANAAIDDSEPASGALIFIIKLSGNEVWRSQSLKKYQSEMAHISLPGSGELTLSLEGAAGMLANWAGARFSIDDPDKPPVSSTQPSGIITSPASDGSSVARDSTLNFSGTVSDTDSASVNIKWYIDRIGDGLEGALIKESNQAPGTTSGTVTMTGTKTNTAGQAISLDVVGATYNLTLKVSDGINAEVQTIRSFLLSAPADTTPPGAPASVKDGPTSGADISSTTSRTQLSANWTASSDAESGISGYQYAIGNTAGGTQTVNWTGLGNVLTVTKTGLSLTIGTTYYFSVKGVNGKGLTGSATNSNGQVVVSTAVADTTPPSAPASVKDGATAGTDVNFMYSTTALSANWTQAADSESGISGYSFAIGSSPGATNILGWTTIGNVLTVTKTGLTLTVGTTYYFSVKATNGSGLTGTAGNSNGQYVNAINTTDTTPPSPPSQVRDGTGASDDEYTYITTELSANWSATADAESGISRYLYAIGTSPGSTNVAGWADNGELTSVTQTGLSLVIGTTYYFSVKAENGVTLQSTPANSDGVCIISGALPPVISNAQAANITENSATISWTTDKQATSQVEYGLTAAYGYLTVEDANLATDHSVAIVNLTAGKTYHYRVISRDSDGNQSVSVDFTFTTLSTPDGVTDIKAYPNPHDFSNGAPMKFKVSATDAGEVKIYTMSGKLVREISGTNEILWDGANEDGERVVRGVYIYKIIGSNGDTITGKLAITR